MRKSKVRKSRRGKSNMGKSNMGKTNRGKTNKSRLYKNKRSKVRSRVKNSKNNKKRYKKSNKRNKRTRKMRGGSSDGTLNPIVTGNLTAKQKLELDNDVSINKWVENMKAKAINRHWDYVVKVIEGRELEGRLNRLQQQIPILSLHVRHGGATEQELDDAESVRNYCNQKLILLDAEIEPLRTTEEVVNPKIEIKVMGHKWDDDAGTVLYKIAFYIPAFIPFDGILYSSDAYVGNVEKRWSDCMKFSINLNKNFKHHPPTLKKKWSGIDKDKYERIDGSTEVLRRKGELNTYFENLEDLNIAIQRIDTFRNFFDLSNYEVPMGANPDSDTENLWEMGATKGVQALEDYKKNHPESTGNIFDLGDKYGNTAAHGAACGGKLENMKYLHIEGANMNIQNLNGDTPLIWAAYYNNFDVVEMLVTEAQVNIDLKNNQGKTVEDIIRSNHSYHDLEKWERIIKKKESETSTDTSD